ncbi:MAG TPA: nucleotide disphospho-sugar-binding domain-containing protein [Thermomicrobiales bacterium]|nr:nucleotide disphospho-sugar-binding domain-containing protein [Thermomicrobiales bacterium]
MAHVLLGSFPSLGHLQPLLVIADHLVAQGHRVSLLTGTRFADRVVAAGHTFVPLTGKADFDDRDLDTTFPERAGTTGIRRIQFEVEHVFAGSIADQYAGLREIMGRDPVDAILIDTLFLGALPLVLRDEPGRPPVIGIGVLPLTQFSRDSAPFGLGLPPIRGPLNVVRNTALNVVSQRMLLRRAHAAAQRIIRETGSPPLPTFILDSTKLYDRYLQLTVPEFDYPRRDLAPNTRYVGPLIPSPRTTLPADLPGWWGDLNGDRPVIHVTQGTVDNGDFERLIRPTLRALEGEDLLVVATTGGRPVEALGPVPDNARVGQFLPYDLLLPKLTGVVTNGGFGGVHQFLRHGIPLVVAGDTEDKPEVAARVGWSGAGVNLRTGSPDAGAIGAGVRRIRDEPSFATAARGIGVAIERARPLDTIMEEIEGQMARRGDGAA